MQVYTKAVPVSKNELFQLLIILLNRKCRFGSGSFNNCGPKNLTLWMLEVEEENR